MPAASRLNIKLKTPKVVAVLFKDLPQEGATQGATATARGPGNALEPEGPSHLSFTSHSKRTV